MHLRQVLAWDLEMLLGRIAILDPRGDGSGMSRIRSLALKAVSNRDYFAV